MTDEEQLESLEEDLNYMSGEMNEIKYKIDLLKLRIAKNAAQRWLTKRALDGGKPRLFIDNPATKRDQ